MSQMHSLDKEGQAGVGWAAPRSLLTPHTSFLFPPGPRPPSSLPQRHKVCPWRHQASLRPQRPDCPSLMADLLGRHSGRFWWARVSWHLGVQASGGRPRFCFVPEWGRGGYISCPPVPLSPNLGCVLGGGGRRRVSVGRLLGMGIAGALPLRATRWQQGKPPSPSFPPSCSRRSGGLDLQSDPEVTGHPWASTELTREGPPPVQGTGPPSISEKRGAHGPGCFFSSPPRTPCTPGSVGVAAGGEAPDLGFWGREGVSGARPTATASRR